MKKNKPTSKLKQFNEELNELLKKYQYTLVPKIKVTENGVTPWMAVVNLIPPKGASKVKKVKFVKPPPVIKKKVKVKK